MSLVCVSLSGSIWLTNDFSCLCNRNPPWTEFQLRYEPYDVSDSSSSSDAVIISGLEVFHALIFESTSTSGSVVACSVFFFLYYRHISTRNILQKLFPKEDLHLWKSMFICPVSTAELHNLTMRFFLNYVTYKNAPCNYFVSSHTEENAKPFSCSINLCNLVSPYLMD